jgi:membrane protease YdiL (CAAX protease family)
MRKSLLFLVIAFSISWLLAFTYFEFFGTQYSWRFALMGALYMFAPALAACAVQYIYRAQIVEPLGISFRVNRWFLLAWLFPPFLAMAATGISLVLPDVSLTNEPTQANIFQFVTQNFSEARQRELQQSFHKLPVHPFFLVLVGGMLAGATINAIAGFGEELGWRGFLQREWAPIGFWKSSWLVGLVWGLWHTPFLLHGHNYPGYSFAGILVMTIWTILFAPLIAYVRLRARSVIAPSIMHGTLNGTALAPMLVLRGGDPLTVGVMGIAGLILLLLLNGGLFLLIQRDTEMRAGLMNL